MFVTWIQAAAPVVSSVSGTQRLGTKFVDITYDLTDPDSTTVAVTLEISSDGGTTWTVPATSLSGDVGIAVTPGTHRIIIWNAGTDWDDQQSATMRYRITASDDPTFVQIPGGTFAMGDAFAEGETWELPIHNVTLSPFFIQRTEVTNNQVIEVFNWALSQGEVTVAGGIVSLTSSSSRELLHLGTAQIAWNSSTQQLELKPSKSNGYPCVGINWYGAAAYCNYLSEKEGLQPCYTISTANNWDYDFSKNGYRLPTEAEWEYAARGGLAGKRFPWGDTISHAQANYRAFPESYPYDVSATTEYHPDYFDTTNPFLAPATDLVTNGYGLHHMAGNAWEFVNDFFNLNSYSPSPNVNPTGAGSASSGGSYGVRVVRGGHWNLGAPSCRVAHRKSAAPNGWSYFTGFRPVQRPVAP